MVTAAPATAPPAIVERRFFASATAPVAAGLVGADRVADVEVELVDLARVGAGLGEAVEDVAVAGFRAAVVGVDTGLAGLLLAAVRRTVEEANDEVAVRFFSSSDTDG